MPEVAEGKGCNFSSKTHIIFEKDTNKNQRALAYILVMQFKIHNKINADLTGNHR
jgi:hypothetical protein